LVAHIIFKYITEVIMDKTQPGTLPFQIFGSLQESTGMKKLHTTLEVLHEYKTWINSTSASGLFADDIQHNSIILSYGTEQNDNIQCYSEQGFSLRGEVVTTHPLAANNGATQKIGALTAFLAEKLGLQKICHEYDGRIVGLIYKQGEYCTEWQSNHPFQISGRLDEYLPKCTLDEIVLAHHDWMQKYRQIVNVWICSTIDETGWKVMGFCKNKDLINIDLHAYQVNLLAAYITVGLDMSGIDVEISRPYPANN
jgi:hypothetical protein